ncbi:MAG: hypothetical protein DRQ55_16375 [Planctomycetota bacterium]|nr:MAG: hypothetical protein DRQ55_16375 [Planctomycetota bacterium]
MSALLGVALLAAAAWVAPSSGRANEPDSTQARAATEPLAAALAPLGPVRALVASVLWAQLVHARTEGDLDKILLVSEGLLAMHPGLEIVREHLAAQIVLTRAPAALDDARHDALVQRGLSMLEDGIALSGSARLHGALGRLLVTQSRVDPRFNSAARRFFGADPLAVAIEELRQAADADNSSIVLADLLVDRGISAWVREGDLLGADRDLAEAEAIAMDLPGPDAATVAQRIAEIRQQMRTPDGGAAPPP